tara:strand:+ start:1049 stop:1882 length:834 start_codon:yes stop_codon:yes gene_type:complete
MATYILREALVFKNGTGFTTNLADVELLGNQSRTVTFSIPQDVSTTSNVEFDDITLSSKVILDNDSLIIQENRITGSFTQTGNLITSQSFIHNGHATIGGIITAEKIVSELTQSATFFDSGSTLFGDSIDDTHILSGSSSISGSININYFSLEEISNDTTLADGSSTSLVTENAVKTYLDDQSDDFQTYARKSFTHTGSFVSVSTASFTATSASAPSGFTSTSEDDFMFFVNGVIAEHNALTIEQSGSTFLMKVNNDSIGYDLQNSDEIVAFGKFNS